MLNAYGTLHGACIAHFVDVYVGLRDRKRSLMCAGVHRCTTLPIIAMSFAQGGTGSPGVSQNINITYHAPARLQVFFSLPFFRFL